MKLLVISDTHNSLNLAQKVIEKISCKISAVLHLGDMYSDAKALEMQYPNLEFHYVAGNCDYYYSTESNMVEEKIIQYNSVKIFMAHGHQYTVKYEPDSMAEAAKSKGATVALFGHTHIPFCKTLHDVLVVNPGSLTYPRGEEKRPTYAVLDINDKGAAHANIVKC